MSQMFDGQGNAVPVSLIEAGPCYVTQVKTKEKDSYSAVQLGFVKKNKARKSEKGKEFRYLKEFRVDEKNEFKAGDEINVSVFGEGDKIKISGTSKGKGFQGAVKRWGFKGKKSATHGTKHEHRTLGSVGTSFPERVIKGRRMPGRTGHERITIKNLKIVKIDKENNLIAVKGAIAGTIGNLVEIRG